MNNILKTIGEILFGSGLWFFIIRSLIQCGRKKKIKNKLLQNLIYEVFTNILVMEDTVETNWKIYENPRETKMTIYKYSYTAWQTFLQSGFIKDIKLRDILILEQLYYQIEKFDQVIKKYYDFPYDRRMEGIEAFKEATIKLIELHNGFVKSPTFETWKKKYAESYEKDQLKLMFEFKGKKLEPKDLSVLTKEEKSNQKSNRRKNDRAYSKRYY